MVRSNQTITENMSNEQDQTKNMTSGNSATNDQADRTGSSILKWIVDRTATSSNFNNASANKNQSKQFDSMNTNTNSNVYNSATNSSSSKQASSLIERIKKKVSETKMIDKGK